MAKLLSLSTQPYKGARDFYPEEMRIRNYIFDIWKKTCKSFGYEEYDGPFLESYDIYAAKSGEEIVNEQLYSFDDRGGRKVAIRPEMTPTLARMVAGQYKTLNRPIKWFSIPNLWRYEKPQRGRLREHFQLNVDVFGIQGVEADFEIIYLLFSILKNFGATDGMFEIRIGNRRLINDFYKSIGISQEKGLKINKALDKKLKISNNDFHEILKKDAQLTENEITKIDDFIENPDKIINELDRTSEGAKEVKKLLKLADTSDMKYFVKYDPTVMRGLDYYTGNVFELFDLSPTNTRAMCGGGRYDDLVELFIDEKLSGIGFGMGDVTFKNFLEEWKLLPKFQSDVDYFITLWPTENVQEQEEFFKVSLELSIELKKKGFNTLMWLEHNIKLEKQLKYADKKGAKFALIVGNSELENGGVTIKNLIDNSQSSKKIDEFIKDIA